MRKGHLLIAGLGNLPHPRTRHSVGQDIVRSLAVRWNMILESGKGGLSASKVLSMEGNPLKITLFVPSALMNISGRSIVKVMNETVALTQNMVVIHDSLDHEPYTISPKFGGSANGHNGVRSVIAALGGNNKFHRLRIGIGRDESDAAEYVLQPLRRQENRYWGPEGEGSDLVVREILRIADSDSTAQR